MEVFRKRFKEAVQDCLVNPDRPDSHVLETLSGRGTLFEIFRREEAMRRLDALESECNRNLKVMTTHADQARYNQKSPENPQFTTSRFRANSVDLLITNRYVDEDQLFFELAEEYKNTINDINTQLSIPEHSPKTTEWLLKFEKSWTELIDKFKDRVEAARKNLSKRF